MRKEVYQFCIITSILIFFLSSYQHKNHEYAFFCSVLHFDIEQLTQYIIDISTWIGFHFMDIYWEKYWFLRLLIKEKHRHGFLYIRSTSFDKEIYTKCDSTNTISVYWQFSDTMYHQGVVVFQKLEPGVAIYFSNYLVFWGFGGGGLFMSRNFCFEVPCVSLRCLFYVKMYADKG